MMRIAVPVRDNLFCAHFGRCTGFLLCDVEQPGRPGRMRQVVRPGAGRCESLPDWLASMAVTHVLVGGIGQVGRARLEQLGLTVHTGHRGRSARDVVEAFLAGKPAGSDNPCVRYRHVPRHCRPKPKTTKSPGNRRRG